MQSKYDDILKSLENSIIEIKDKHGISIGPLNESIANLKKHTENISKIERDIDAIKEEVIDEIKIELQQNKRAGKFSIFGFYVGAFGLIASIISLWFVIIPSFSATNIETLNNSDDSSLPIYDNRLNGRLSSIEKNLDFLTNEILGINSDYKPTTSELLIKQFEEREVLKSDSNIVSFKVWGIDESSIEGNLIPVCRLIIFINGKQLGEPGIKKFVKVINKNGMDNFGATLVNLSENDEFIVFNKYQYQVKRIFRDNSRMLPISDKYNGVLIKVI